MKKIVYLALLFIAVGGFLVFDTFSISAKTVEGAEFEKSSVVSQNRNSNRLRQRRSSWRSNRRSSHHRNSLHHRRHSGDDDNGHRRRGGERRGRGRGRD